ncbi:hypothetical protein [Bosea sp. ANAM02]|uniref:hypothetical protein n=1 Tax=Bosea sp. ANAM02 TaxID=2020412 RepID=UPI00140F414C|nr:hypothetical protein [Bosea sp. ANAM02]BCB17335.1 hypothetical protein OCUBac02_02290 [Bosea sp. ANAM02]
MPRASAAAAVTGLPENIEADFHLNLGRAIARAGADIVRAEEEIAAIEATNAPGAGVIKASLDHAFDREEALIRALATSPASSLAGAAVQLAAAVKFFAWATMEETPRPEDERAINRLMTSALTVMVDAAGLDAARDGIDHLVDPRSNQWRDVYQRLAELFPATASEETSHEG